MNKILIIAQREFLMAVGHKAYFISLIIFPLLILGFGLLQSINVEQAMLSRSLTIGVIDQAGVIDFSVAEKVQTIEVSSASGVPGEPQQFKIIPYAKTEEALPDLRTGKLGVLYVLPPDYRNRGMAETYMRDEVKPREPYELELAVFQNLVKVSALRQQVTPEELDRLIAPIKVTRLVVAENGTIHPARDPYESQITWMAPIGLITVLAIWVMLSSRYMLSSAREEEANRVMEVMLSTVKSNQLIWGKLLGLSGVAILQMLTFLCIVGLVRTTLWTFLTLSASTLALCLVFAIAGYLFYAGFMTAVGLAGWGRAASFMTLIVWLPVLMADTVANEPNGTAAQALSYFPLTASMTMVLRLSLSNLTVADILAPLIVLIVCAYLAVYCGAKVFRISTLMLGKRVTLSEITRWLRSA
jgi:ABC-2 type transport system permease protein